MPIGSSSTPNLSFIGIVDFSQEARWIYMTESVTDLLGYEPRDLVGRPSLELVHPDEFPRVKQLHYDTIRQDKAAVLVYLRMKHKDPLKGYVLCGVSRTVVHDVLVGSVSFANPNKALQNASTAQEITVIAPEARNFQFRRWHDPSPMPASPIPEAMRVLPAALLQRLENYGAVGGGMNGGGATIEYVDVPDRRPIAGAVGGNNGAYASYAQSPPASRSPSPPPRHLQDQHRHAPSVSPYAAGSAYGRDGGYQREYDYEYTRSGGASQESYARRRSPSYALDAYDVYERDRERERERDRDQGYPLSPAESPVYTPQSPYSLATPLDARRRLSHSSSSSSSSGSSRAFARPGVRHTHTRNGVHGANGAHARNGVNGADGAHGVHGLNGTGDVDADGDEGGGGRRLGHSTSWTRHRVGGETPTPDRSARLGGEGGGDRARDRDVDMDRIRDRDVEEERRREMQRERERELARDLEEEERHYQARYASPGRDADSRDGDFAANRYYSPPPSSTSLNGANGHGNNVTTSRHPPEAHAHAHRSLTPSPPRSAYRSSASANAPGSPTYASVTRSSPPHRHLLPSPRIAHQPPPPPAARHREPSPVITFDHLPAQSSRTAFILDRFTDKSSIMFCSNTLLVCPTSPGSAPSPPSSSSPITAHARRSGSPPGQNTGGSNTDADELAQANAIGRPFYDFVVPRDEQIVRDWIACVKGWGVNEKGQPSDGGFGFGRFGLVKEGRESAPRNPDPAPSARGGRNRHGSTSGRGRNTGTTRRGIDQTGRRRPGANNGASGAASNTGGSSPPGATAGDSDPEREREAQRQRQRDAEVTVIEVDAIFSAHSDGLMVILRRAT